MTTNASLAPIAALMTLSLVSMRTAVAGPETPVFEEVGGLVAIEAEAFARQTSSDRRAWHIVAHGAALPRVPDGDPPHVLGASLGAYVEVLPDTRRTHDDVLVPGENFSDEPGQAAVLSYRVRFRTPGRYYVWARAFSTGTEDNGLHVGIDGTWPESGHRMQWCDGKGGWHWDSKQRTKDAHCGMAGAIYLDVERPGEHQVQVSMREDGFELDKLVLTTNRAFAAPAEGGPVARRRLPDGSGAVKISGELKRWHKVTLTLDGPFADERDDDPNPFTDHRMTVLFKHESGSPSYRVPGYFAADGQAAESGATSGRQWRAHLSPDKPGRWSYEISFVRGKQVAVSEAPGESLAPYQGRRGQIRIAPTDKRGVDLRAKGRLQYVGKHHLRFNGTGEYFLKAGPDAPETLLGYADFDGTQGRREKVPLKTWSPHAHDWRPGDPTWQNGKGKGLVGALNYLAAKGMNTFSFLTYNAGGDGDNVWPFVARDDKQHYDCSKLDQWGIVFDHAQKLGLHLHIKLQETEIDDNVLRDNKQRTEANVPEALDRGDLGPERRLYLREIIARFGHALALNWNLGEENTQSPEQQRAMSAFIRDTDPYQHSRVIHSFPEEQDRVYTPLLGDASTLTGASLQNPWNAAHRRTLKWLTESAKAGKPWVVANDEQGGADTGVPPDPDYAGFGGKSQAPGKANYDLHDVRKATLWGNLMAGGAGVEYYFGYKLPQNDLNAEDWRSRDHSWDYARIALAIFRDARIPFWEMKNANALVGNQNDDDSRWCLAKTSDIYLVYLPRGGSAELDLLSASGAFAVEWWNPRTGGAGRAGSVARVQAGARVALGTAPSDPDEDWLVVVRRR